MEFSKIIFNGQYRTLAQIIFIDPDWFFEKFKNGDFKKGTALLKQAEYINHRARNIRIPENESSQLEVRYILTPNLIFDSFVITQKNLPYRLGLKQAIRDDKINMYFPKSLPGYDKKWYIPFLKSLKQNLFGNQKKIIREESCDIFFSNGRNFELDLPPRRGFL